MDPACENKIQFLQKYVPFLAKLIERLANDSEKESKLMQMQLLYDLLNKPDNSVKIETLDKCEEVLSRVFANADGKDDEIDEASEPNVSTISSPAIKIEPDETDDCLEDVEEQIVAFNCDNINPTSELTSDKGEQKSCPQRTLLKNTHSPNSNYEEKMNVNTEPCTSESEPINESEDEPKVLETSGNAENDSKRHPEVCTVSVGANLKTSDTIKNTLEKDGTLIALDKSQCKENCLTKAEYSQEHESDIVVHSDIKQKHTRKNSNLDEGATETEESLLILDSNNENSTKDQVSENRIVALPNTGEPLESLINDSNNDCQDCSTQDKDTQGSESNIAAFPDTVESLQTLADKNDDQNSSTQDKNPQVDENIIAPIPDTVESLQRLVDYSKNDGQDSSTKDKNSHVSESNTAALSDTLKPLQTLTDDLNSGEHECNSKAKEPQVSESSVETLPSMGEPLEHLTKNSNSDVSNSIKKRDTQVSKCSADADESFKVAKTDSKNDDNGNTTKDEECQTAIVIKDDNSLKLSAEDSTADYGCKPTKEKSSKVVENRSVILSEDEAPKSEESNDIGDATSSLLENNNTSSDQERKTTPGTDQFIGDQQSDVIIQSESEMTAFKIISAESLATPFAQSLSENDELGLILPLDNKSHETPNDCENESIDSPTDKSQNCDLDPLEPSSIPKTVPVVNGSNNSNSKNDDNDEDDDVLLIENRSSPICLDSDPEDEQINQIRTFPPIKSSRTTASIQKEKPKSVGRKSTGDVVDTIVRQMAKQKKISVKKIPIHKKTKPGYLVKRDPKALMETINLIDSDSEDEPPKKAERTKSIDDDVIIVSSTQPARKLTPSKNAPVTPLSKQSPRLPSKSANKPTPKPATAQSNFLNAVNLQPAPKSNSNPASFSAQLSNKKVLIPNAFYGNPSYNRKLSSSSAVAAMQEESSSNDSVTQSRGSPSVAGSNNVQDKLLKDWLEGFLTNFASPLQIASHACFVLLQRVLKYRFFQRLKETRVHLNTLAKNFVPETMDVQMLLDLRNVFLENDTLTEAGRRFCRFATNDAFGKPVALTTDSRTGKVTCRTRIGSNADISTENRKTSIPEKSVSSSQMTPPNSASATVTSANPVTSTPSTPNSNAIKRGRKIRKLSDGLTAPDVDDDDNDYTPSMGELIPEEEIVSERKRSLRTNRTKRKEAGFTYSEDHDDEEFEALAKKIEDKKREELRLAEERELEMERENERKTKKTVAKKTTSKRQGTVSILETMGMEAQKEPSRKKLRLVDTEILGNADDLLTPTWVEADGDDADGEVDSLLDFEGEPEPPEKHQYENNAATDNKPEESGAQDSDDSESYPPCFDVGTNKLLKNTDRNLHIHSQSFDYCVHCLKRVPRTVHHYVNEHRSSEVFTSRLRTKDIRRLLTTSNLGFVHLYKGNQQQYAAHCIFCDKESRFLLPYWFEHFTMHTGEYSFKCSGCHIKKPTRSLLTNHFQSGNGCPKKGTAVRLHFFDTKSHQIEAYICSICNYVQVHRKNVVRHLRNHHEIDTVLPNHIIRVVLLQVSAPYRDQETTSNDESQLSLLQHSDGEDNCVNGTSMAPLEDNSLMLQNSFTDNDDLSFMICGMLDVQTNLSSSGDLLANIDKTNTVDNK